MKKLSYLIPVLVGVVAILSAILIRNVKNVEEGESERLTSSTLVKAIDITELSTAEYTYNGIATLYKNQGKKNEKLLCHIRYNAIVKAYIDMSEITFDIDHDNLTVHPILPEIELKVILDDEKALSFMPEKAKVEYKNARTACEEDAYNESIESEELFEVAEENLRNIIEALLYPIINAQGYTIIWD